MPLASNAMMDARTRRSAKRAKIERLPSLPRLEGGTFAGGTLNGTFSGQYAEGVVPYRRGEVLGRGASGTVSRYAAIATVPEWAHTSLAVKQFAHDGDYQAQQRAARALRAEPSIARYLVDAVPIGRRIVMPSYRVPCPGDDPWSVWSQTRDAALALRAAGYAYFDLKLANLLIDARGTVKLGDIDGLVGPAPQGPPREVSNTYAYPGHNGFLLVHADNVRLCETLCTHYALIELALALLNPAHGVVGPLYHGTIAVRPMLRIVRSLEKELAIVCPIAGPAWSDSLVLLPGEETLAVERDQLAVARRTGDGDEDMADRLERVEKIRTFYEDRPAD